MLACPGRRTACRIRRASQLNGKLTGAGRRGLRSGLAIREITSTAGCLLILPRPRLASSNGREHAMRIGFPGTGTAGRHLRPEVAGPEPEVPPEPDMMDKDTAEL